MARTTKKDTKKQTNKDTNETKMTKNLKTIRPRIKKEEAGPVIELDWRGPAHNSVSKDEEINNRIVRSAERRASAVLLFVYVLPLAILEGSNSSPKNRPLPVTKIWKAG